MRIVLLISNLIYGGAETQVIALARELQRRGHIVAVYTLNRENPRAIELDGSGVKIVVDQKRMPFDPIVLIRLRRFLRKFHADIVHGFLFDGDFYSRLATIGTGIPALNSERNDSYQLNRNQRVGHVLTRRLASGVVANSHAGGLFAQKLFGLSSSHIHVAWNGIDLNAIDARISGYRADVRTEFFGTADVRVACMVGSIKPQKDYLLALRVAHRLTTVHPEWRVLFVGEKLDGGDAYKTEVMQEWRRAGLCDRVVFAGLRRDAIEITSQCNVLLSTSLHEGFPNVVLEAMAAGTPVVSTEYSDIKMILPFAWQVRSQREPERLVSAIIRADQERKDVSTAQRAWVVQNATIEASTTRMEDIYRSYVSVSEGKRAVASVVSRR